MAALRQPSCQQTGGGKTFFWLVGGRRRAPSVLACGNRLSADTCPIVVDVSVAARPPPTYFLGYTGVLVRVLYNLNRRCSAGYSEGKMSYRVLPFMYIAHSMLTNRVASLYVPDYWAC